MILYVFTSDGYSKLKGQQGDSDSDDVFTNKDKPDDPKNEAKVDQSKTANKSHDLFGAPARLVKRVVENLTYQQFKDVDSDHDGKKSAENNQRDMEKVKGGIGSSSECHEDRDHDAMMLKKKASEFGYEELDDEFGSRRPKESGDPDESSDTSRQTYDEYDTRHPVHGNKIPAPQPPAQNQDRIVGHQYGVKPLLDDDELSDSEFGRCDKNQASKQKEVVTSRGSTAMSDASSALSTLTPPTSPQSQPSEEANNSADVFTAAPFKVKRGSKKKRSSKPSTPKNMDNADVFANAPFKVKTPTVRSPSENLGNENVYVSHQQMAPVEERKFDVFGNMPFTRLSSNVSPAGSNPSTTVSPSNVEMRSPSQSPAEAGAAARNKQSPMQMGAPTPPVSPPQVDLFGSGNFASMTFVQVQQVQHQQTDQQKQQQHIMQQQAYQQQQQNVFHQQQQHLYKQQNVYQQQQQGNYQQPVPISSVGPPLSPSQNAAFSQDLFGAVPFTDLNPSILQQESVQPNLSDVSTNVARSADGSRKQSKGPLSGVKKTPTRHRKTSGGHHPRRRGSSDSRSSGSEGKPSPRSSKKDAQGKSGRLYAAEVLHDENVEVYAGGEGNYGSLKKKSKGKKTPVVKSNTAFANLSYMDDASSDFEQKEEAYMTNMGFCESAVKFESQVNMSMDALKSSNAANYMSEGSNTLPRSGSKKHRVLPNTPDVEPFSLKKKSGGIFK